MDLGHPERNLAENLQAGKKKAARRVRAASSEKCE